METWITLGGALLFFALIMLSIAFHELGHFTFAKLFKVRTTQFMVGFGPTMWSRTRGETEYGVKWIPFGGYIRMIGMLPPRKQDAPGRVRRLSTGPFQGMIESARGAAMEEVRPDDGDRVFYGKKWWQKLLIMLGGPAANILLAVVFFAILIMGIGTMQTKPVISTVSKCVVPQSEADRECEEGDPLTPAASAGLQPGDRFVSFDGRPISSYDQVQRLIRDSAGERVTMMVQRDGEQLPVRPTITTNELRSLDDPSEVETVGFLGITPLQERERGGPGAVVDQMAEITEHTAGAFARLPERMVGVWNASFGGEERDPQSPVSVVGASRFGGEVAASEAPGMTKVTFFISLLAIVNFAVAAFNLIPLLPLDGGHVAGALWEAIKRGFAKLFRRPDPGYVDVAKALPLTYAVFSVLLLMGVLLIYADLFNPIRLSG